MTEVSATNLRHAPSNPTKAAVRIIVSVIIIAMPTRMRALIALNMTSVVQKISRN